MRARGEPLAEKNRLARLGHGANDVGAGHRLRHGGRRLDDDPVPRPFGPREGGGLVAIPSPDPNSAQRAHRQHGLEMTAGLLARSEQRQIAGVRARQQPRCQSAGGGGAYRGDLGGVEQRHGTAMLGLEQQHQAQMR